MSEPFRKLLSAKIHRATVTQADLDYEGSLTIPPALLEAAGIVPYEAVSVWNVTRGSRLETYAIAGQPASRDVCANGAAAHLIQPGDRVIIASFTYVPDDRVAEHRPRLVFVDDRNTIVHRGPEIPGPQRRIDAPDRPGAGANAPRAPQGSTASRPAPGDASLTGSKFPSQPPSP